MKIYILFYIIYLRFALLVQKFTDYNPSLHHSAIKEKCNNSTILIVGTISLTFKNNHFFFVPDDNSYKEHIF